MSTRETPESGLYTGLVEFYRESTSGQFNTDPSYLRFSDEVIDVSYSPGFGPERRDALGTPNAAGHNQGNEEGEIEITYRLQRQLIDGSGNPDDPAGDAWLRNSDNRIPNTHSIRIREDRSNSDPDDPDNADGARKYIIGMGGKPDNEMEGPIEDGAPIESTITYMCDKVRDYEVFQPNGSESLDIASTDSGDTSQTLEIEDDSGNSESVSLNGTTTETTTKSDWSSLRAAELDAETVGDVTISLTSSGDTLLTIRGADHYSQGGNSLEGDLGIPAIGSGSLGSTVGNSFEYFITATVNHGGSPFPYDVAAASWSIANGWDTQGRHGTVSPRIDEGNVESTVEFDLIGWGVSSEFLEDAVSQNTNDVSIETASTKFTWNNGVAVGPDGVERGPDDSAIAYGVEFEDSDDGGVSVTQP